MVAAALNLVFVALAACAVAAIAQAVDAALPRWGPLWPAVVLRLTVLVLLPLMAAAGLALAGHTVRLLRRAAMETSGGAAALAVNLALAGLVSILLGWLGWPSVQLPPLATLSEAGVAALAVLALILLAPLTLRLLVRSGAATRPAAASAAALHAFAVAAVVLLFVDARVVPDRIFEQRAVTAGERELTIRIERDYRRQLEAGAEARTVFPPIAYGPAEVYVGKKFEEPGREHLLGTDRVGRSNIARIIFGTRVSLAVGFISVAISVAIGIFIGGISGYFGGWVDLTLQRIVEIFISFPTFFLLLTIIALFGPRLWLIMVAIGLTSWTGTARLIRSGALQARRLDYVVAARSQGLRPLRIIMAHTLPNIIAPVLVSATFGVAGAVTLEVTLSFLGLSDPDYPSWGLLLEHLRGVAVTHPTLVVVAAVPIFFAVLAYNLVGEGLRDAIDPRLKI
jgi:peptide/nickel transport system permease protein